MSVKFTNGVDLVKTAIINALLHPVSADPSTPLDGQVWYRTDTDRLHMRANSVTQTIPWLTEVTAGSITSALWDAQTYIKAISDDTPVAQIVGSGEFVGRPVGGDLGVMTAAQARTSLNIEDGSTADQTAGEILAALLTVDGPGSGLDADTLDGIQLAALATIAYVDGAIEGFTPKNSVRVATTANITLSGAQTIDSVAVGAGDRVLVKDQTAGETNGIYVAAAGAWSRSLDTNTAAEIRSAYVPVEQGTVNENTFWLMRTDEVTLGTTPLEWTQFGAATVYTAGSGLTLTGTVFSIGPTQVVDSMLASTFVKKHTALIGDGAAINIAVTHNLGSKAHVYSVRSVATDEFVIPDNVATTSNVDTFSFAVAPTLDQYEVTIIG